MILPQWSAEETQALAQGLLRVEIDYRSRTRGVRVVPMGEEKPMQPIAADDVVTQWQRETFCCAPLAGTRSLVCMYAKGHAGPHQSTKRTVARIPITKAMVDEQRSITPAEYRRRMGWPPV